MCYRHIFRKRMLCRHLEISIQRVVMCPRTPCPLGGIIDDELGLFGEESVPCPKCISDKKWVKNDQGEWIVAPPRPYIVAGITIA